MFKIPIDSFCLVVGRLPITVIFWRPITKFSYFVCFRQFTRMPKIKEGAKYQKTYSQDDIRKALEAIKSGIPVREVSRRFNIPRATLQFRKSDKFKKTGFGPPPVLTSEEEALLIKWIEENHRKGFPRRKEDLQYAVKEFLDLNPRKNPFVNNLPGNGWYKAFLKRHPHIALRTPEAVTAASANVSEQNIRKWFTDIFSYLETKGYSEILLDQSRPNRKM